MAAAARANRWLQGTVAAIVLCVTSGCAVVSLKQDGSRHGTTSAVHAGTGRDDLSADTRAALSTIGRRPEDCRRQPQACADAFEAAAGIAGDRIHASLAELYLAHAINTDCGVADSACQDLRSADLIESARNAYLYMFFGEHTPEQRVFERRQAEVRVFYNKAVQELVALLYARYRAGEDAALHMAFDGDLQLDFRLSEDLPKAPPQELVAASALAFDGLRNSYQRDGFGAEFVAVYPEEGETSAPFRQLNYRPVTMALSFEGDNAAQVRAARGATLQVFDAYRSQQAHLAGRDVPLAANFSAAYGLWLARTNLTKLGMSGLMGRGEADRDRPRVVLLEPYDPDRRVLILIHGLASSQEAWINVANEVMGDPILRERFQIWQVVYPTRMPILMSAARIESGLRATFLHFDANGDALASRDAVLVGHSMGGVIARLLVTPMDPGFLDRLLPPSLALDAQRRAELATQPGIREILQLSPLPQVGCAVFIASPHRGTPVAEWRIAKLVRRLMRLPLDALNSFNAVVSLTGASKKKMKQEGLSRLPNGADELAQDSRFMLATRDMPIEPGLPFYSIIARTDPRIPLQQSSDGLVPYTSSHLAGAVSELVVTSGHSVQETPEAILELRRIMHEDALNFPVDR